ncbi:MAG: oligosaccharide flippase family protein [Myxococcaceae bacterium]
MKVATHEHSSVAKDSSSSVHIPRNAMHLVLGQAVTMVLGILFSSMVGHKLGAEGFGLYFLITSFSTFALVLVDWGQQYFGIREVARNPERGGDLLGTGLVLRVLGTAVVCVPAGMAAWALGYDRRTIWFSVGMIVFNLPFFLAQNFGIVFRGQDRMGLDATVSVVNRAVGLVIAFLAVSLGFGLGGVVVAQGLAGGAALAVAFQLYKRVKTGPLRVSRATAREILGGGTAIVAISIAVYVQPYIDAVLLSKMVTTDVLGWYGAAKNIMGTLLAPSLILGSAAFPRLSRATKHPGTFAKEFATAQRPMLWLGGLAAVGTWVFADLAITVIYPKAVFGPASDVLRVFGLGLFLIFEDVLIGTGLTALGRATQFAVVKIASVVLGVGLELLLIPYWQHRTGNGGVGVSLSFVLSEVVMFTGGVLLMPKGTLGKALGRDGGRALGCALVTAVFFHYLPHQRPWVGVPLCILVFTGLSLACGLLHKDDVQVVKGLLRRQAASSPVVPEFVETQGAAPE